MFGLDLLFEKNQSNRKNRNFMPNKRLTYISHANILDGNEIRRIIDFINGAKVILQHHSKLILNLNSIKAISDKLCMVTFECICKYLIEHYNTEIDIRLSVECGIGTEGIRVSPLNKLNNLDFTSNKSFLNKFDFEIYQNHYRRVVKCDKDSVKAATREMEDMTSFFEVLRIDSVIAEQLSEVISELIDNSMEHAKADCLVDIDVSSNYNKAGDTGNYQGINVVVLNFSDKLLGEDIANQINTDNDAYKKLREAKKNHSMYWNNNYTEKDFFIMSAFQNKISTRKEKYFTGGKGLTSLIKSLGDGSDSSICYALTGKRVLFLNHEFLKLDSEKWVGFNKHNDFVNFPPDESSTSGCNVYFPGTAFNLTFVIKKETNRNV